MIYLMLNKYQYTQEKLRQESMSKKLGSHLFAIKHIHPKIREMGHIFKAEDFRRNIGELKNYREQADYTDNEIKIDLSKDALGKANAINAILYEVFNIAN